MKFSKKKKAKMRYYRNRRIKRVFNSISYSVGSHGWEWNDDADNSWETVDCAYFRHTCYVLAENYETGEYAIFKMVSECICESVKLSAKKLAENRRTFNSPSVWERKSDVVISDSGVIEKVEIAAHEKTFSYGSGRFIIYVPIY